MKAAVVKGNSKVEIENFTISDVGSNELLIKMKSCGICGTSQHVSKKISSTKYFFILGNF